MTDNLFRISITAVYPWGSLWVQSFLFFLRPDLQWMYLLQQVEYVLFFCIDSQDPALIAYNILAVCNSDMQTLLQAEAQSYPILSHKYHIQAVGVSQSLRTSSALSKADAITLILI